MRIHLGKHSDVAERVEMGAALCGAGEHSRTETEQYVTAIYDDVTCRNCIRIVRASNMREERPDVVPTRTGSTKLACATPDPNRRAWCTLPPGHPGRHQDSWGKKFNA